MSTQRTRSRSFWQTGSRTGVTSRTYRTGRTGRVGDATRTMRPAEHRRLLLRRWWRRTNRHMRRVWRTTTQAITPIGWFVLAVTVLGVLAGAAFGWIEGWFVAVIGALVLLIGLPFLIGSRSYRTRIELARANVVVGGELHASVRVENSAARPQLPAVAELPVGEALHELTVPLLGPHQVVELPVAVPATRRGVVAVGPLTVARRDPLGLLRREMTWRDRHLVHVHPRTTPLPANSAGLVRDLEGQPSRRLTESDLSFHAVRDYMPGDSVRNIHWKSTAKTGSLMVRQFEESQTARVAVLFDARREEYASDDEFELGVSVAASLSLQAVREGRERFVVSAWTPGRLRPSVDALEELPSRTPVEMLDSWAELQAVHESLPFEALARNLAESGRSLSIVIVVTGSVPEVTRMRRASISFPPDVHVLGVRCEWLADPKAQTMPPLELLTVGALGDLPRLMARSQR